MALQCVIANSNWLEAVTAGVEVTSRVTLSTWFKLTSLPGAGVFFTLPNKGNSSSRSYSIDYTDAAGTKKFRIVWTTAPSTFVVYEHNIVLVAGQWYHLLVEIDWTQTPDLVALYLDNVSKALTRTSGAADTTPESTPLLKHQVGALGGINLAAASFAQHYIFDMILPAEEKTLLARGMRAKRSPVVQLFTWAIWNVGGIEPDKSGNNRRMAINGIPGPAVVSHPPIVTTHMWGKF